MSEQRWAVLSARPGNGWLVVHPGDVFRYDGILDCADVHSTYSTWEEAMQEADRMARTVTVTLPAGPSIAADADLENIALALLAHVRKDRN